MGSPRATEADCKRTGAWKQITPLPVRSVRDEQITVEWRRPESPLRPRWV